MVQIVGLLLIIVSITAYMAPHAAKMRIRTREGQMIALAANEGDIEKSHRPSAVGTRRNSPSSSGGGMNINSANAKANEEYQRQKEVGDGWKRSDIRNVEGGGNDEKRVYNGRAGSRQPQRSRAGGRSGEFGNALTDQWQSGKIFKKRNGQRGGGRRRNDPWWMSDEERNNPRILPTYIPWWLESNVLVDSSWKVADLKIEALRRADENGRVGAVAGRDGGYTSAEIDKLSKTELVELLVSLTRKYDLSNEGYTTIQYFASVRQDGLEKPPCYPQVYEGGHEQMMDVVLSAYEQILAN